MCVFDGFLQGRMESATLQDIENGTFQDNHITNHYHNTASVKKPSKDLCEVSFCFRVN